jgi:hypothetical protein
MATKKTPRRTNRRKYLITGQDVMRITGIKWSYIQFCIWRTGFRWDVTGKVKKGVARKGKLMPVKGKRFSPSAVWDVNDFLTYDPKKFRKLATRNAWTRLHYDLNDFGDD